jgi:hypothetical protein
MQVISYNPISASFCMLDSTRMTVSDQAKIPVQPHAPYRPASHNGDRSFGVSRMAREDYNLFVNGEEALCLPGCRRARSKAICIKQEGLQSRVFRARGAPPKSLSTRW